MTNDDVENSDAYEDYISHRKSLITLRVESTKSYDQALLTLSGGALGISIAFIENLAARPPIVPAVLNWAWGLLAVALLSTLLSFFSSQKALGREIEIWDNMHGNIPEGKQVNRWSEATSWLNGLSALFFITGIACLIWFSSANLPYLRPLPS